MEGIATRFDFQNFTDGGAHSVNGVHTNGPKTLQDPRDNFTLEALSLQFGSSCLSAVASMNGLPMIDVTLIQIRHPDDAMASHERECLERRVSGRAVNWHVRNVYREQPRLSWLDQSSAMIIGGSGSYSVHDARSTPWVSPLREVLELALKSALPSLGICFGHQLLGFHLGSKVETDPSSAEIGTIPIELTDAGIVDPLLKDFAPSFLAHTGHSDSVIGVPEGVTVLGRSSVLATQIFKVDGAPFYSTQFHPDISGEEARFRYAAYQRGLAQAIPTVAMEESLRYHVGSDDSNRLIGHFLDRLT